MMNQALPSAVAVAPSNKKLWVGRALSAFVSLFLLFDSAIKVLRLPPAIEGTTKLGFPEGAVFGLGLLELACVVVYLTPRASIVGAVLLTGYLGGAIATHVRMGDPLLSHTMFPLYVAAMIWGGLFLRDSRLRVLLSSPTKEPDSAA